MFAQLEDRAAIMRSYEAMRKMGGAKGYKLPAHPIDRIHGMSIEDFAQEYLKIIQKCSDKPFAVRQYISQLGQQAYNLTVAQIVVEEFPELESILIPKTNQS